MLPEFLKTPLGLCLTLGCFLVLTTAPESSALPGDEHWSDEFYLSGLSSIPRTFVHFKGDVIVGGDFEFVEQMRVDHIARFDGENWWPMGNGLDRMVIDAIVFENDLIVSGYFENSGDTPLNHVARWDGASWEPMGAGLPYGHSPLVIYSGILYCENYRWTGSQWVTAFNVAGGISDMVVFDGRLVVCGNLESVNGVEVDFVFTWDGYQVEACYQGEIEPLVELETTDGQLFAISRHLINTPSTVKAWSGTQWKLVGDLEISNDFRRTALMEYSGSLVLASRLRTGSGVSYTISLDKWNGSHWQELDSFPGDTPLCFTEHEDGLLIGGNVWVYGSIVSPHMLFWEPGQVHPLFGEGGQGLLGDSGRITCLAPGSNGLAVGGRFLAAGQTTCQATALWNATGWEDWGLQGTGFSYPTANYWSTDQLGCVAYPSFDFTHNNLLWHQEGLWHEGTECANIEQFFTYQDLVFGAGDHIYQVMDPNNIVEIAELMGGTARCFGQWNNDLVAGGNFSLAGSTPVSNIAAWDGNQWHPLGAGFDNVVRALAVFRGQLFAGGSFESSGTTEVDYIARWDGSAWQPLGSGLNEYIRHLAVYDDKLFVGGYFTRAGGHLAQRICSWDDQSLSPVPMENSGSFSPVRVSLRDPVPNPFNPVTILSYELDSRRHVRLEIYDLAGHLVVSLIDETQSAGPHQTQWRGQDSRGQKVPSGSYLVRLSTEGQVLGQKVTLLY